MSVTVGRIVLGTVLGLAGIARPAVAQSRQWAPVGGGMNNVVWALTVFDDGTGPVLYAGGNFSAAGGVPAYRVAKWAQSSCRPATNLASCASTR